MRIFTAALLTAGLVALAGCGGNSRGLVAVKGKITMDGTPLNKATITFVPDGGGTDVATGISDDEGNFFMVATGGGDKGVVPGKYKITVLSYAETPTPSRNMGDMIQEQMAAKGEVKPAASAGSDALKQKQKDAAKAGKAMRASPAIYNDITKTPLTVTVPVPADFKIELTKEGK